MQYIIPALLVLLGIVNLNLIRVGLECGEIQSRFLHIRKESSPIGFWCALVFQVVISALCFAVALVRFAYPEL
ncbi:hypothetical protein [Desulfobaculum bizertense]|uniref:Uncharacterized protein n=1 Tax=Desulfobaculum bizertense DSM 18034 TaxID=1121442 RepID=A0A1T4VWA5_9BACT|nr:hypothetical protein [Desulfobaculum bizertense]UIJ36785.1 hypothetical protein LWC08_08530 [Desulfobaculum bizertense]SKA69266.1 hypothetical protein SAMN02745702_01085 [Desulfobaculum bizertense DSM 18034]